MSTSVTLVSEWNSGISATIYQIGEGFCITTSGQNSSFSVHCGLDEINTLRDWLNERIADAAQNYGVLS